MNVSVLFVAYCTVCDVCHVGVTQQEDRDNALADSSDDEHRRVGNPTILDNDSHHQHTRATASQTYSPQIFGPNATLNPESFGAHRLIHEPRTTSVCGLVSSWIQEYSICYTGSG